MKIMSFNTQHCLNFVEKKIDFHIMAETIKACGADIVGLNEMYDEGPGEDYVPQVQKLAELTGLSHFYFAPALLEDGNPYGNGILSRLPIVEAETIAIPDPDPKTGDRYYETRGMLKAKLENGVTVLVSHFGLNTDEQASAVTTFLANRAKEKCILMGDFNTTPEDAVLNPIRACMKDTADLFAQPLLSFPSDKPERKIDYIFVTPDMEVLEADIPAIVASDHRPHTATVKIGCGC